MSNREWIEGRQRFRYRGVCIETTKPANMRLAYGDERVQQLQEERSQAAAKPRTGLRRLLLGFGSKRKGLVEPATATPEPLLPAIEVRHTEPEPAPVPQAEPVVATAAEPAPVPVRQPRPTLVVSPVAASADPPNEPAPELALCRQALAKQERTFGEGHPWTAITIHNLACLCRDNDRHDEAEQWFERAQRIWESRLGPDHPNLAQNLVQWAELRRRTGDGRHAAHLEARASAIRGKIPA